MRVTLKKAAMLLVTLEFIVPCWEVEIIGPTCEWWRCSVLGKSIIKRERENDAKYSSRGILTLA